MSMMTKGAPGGYRARRKRRGGPPFVNTDYYSPKPRKINERQHDLKPDMRGWRLRQFIEDILDCENESDTWAYLGYGFESGDGESCGPHKVLREEGEVCQKSMSLRCS